MILQWHKEHGLKLPPELKAAEDRQHLKMLLEKMSGSLYDQMRAAKQICLLTKQVPSSCTFFCESKDTISQLLSPFCASKVDDYPYLQQDLIATLENLCKEDHNRKRIADHPLVIHYLIESLKFGTIETRTHAAGALFLLSANRDKYDRLLIGDSGALKLLIDLVEVGPPSAAKNANKAIFHLCEDEENVAKAVLEGAVRVLLGKIKEGVFGSPFLATLALLSCHYKAVEELVNLGGVGCMLSMMRGSTCNGDKETCAMILYDVCGNVYGSGGMEEIRAEEKANRTISNMAENGTPRAKEKAIVLYGKG